MPQPVLLQGENNAVPDEARVLIEIPSNHAMLT
jgi:hypothetical protein